MGKKDIEIKTTIENILEHDFSGQQLQNYFDALPAKSIRRAISILSRMYPGATTISDDDFPFILFMFSDIKFMRQDSFPSFVFAVNLIHFTDRQKKLLINTIKNNIEILCDTCMFELDALLVSVFEPDKLLQYLEVLVEKGSRPLLQRVSDILRYEDFSHSAGSDDKIEALQQKISQSIDC